MKLLCVLVVGVLLIEADANKGTFKEIPDMGNGESPHDYDNLFEGDIRLSPEQKQNQAVFGDPDGGPGRAATNVDKKKWPNGIVYYEFDCSVANMDRVVRTTMEAIAEWESKTCLKFKKRTNEKNYIWFHRGNSCWSDLGFASGVETYLSIGNNCDYKHVMMHEIGHAIGFWHEHNRPDRDNYVKINYENILEGSKRNFKKKLNTEVIDYGVPFDYGSIMLYPWKAFSKNGKKTLEPLGPLNGKTPYVRLSDDDALQARRMYKCSDGLERSSRQRRAERCADISPSSDCNNWKKEGFCTQNSVTIYWCKKTCDFCSSDACMDLKFECKGWAQSGMCKSDPQMKMNCRHTCDFCKDGGSATEAPVTQGPTEAPPTGPSPPTTNFAVGLRCLDTHRKCKRWAAEGKCVTNAFVERACRISCKTRCDAKEPKPTGNCTSSLGLGWDFKGYARFTASSVRSPGGRWSFRANNARLYFEDDHTYKRIGAWCGAKPENQWLQIDLGRIKHLTGIATQGRDVFSEHVKKYRLQFSDDGSNWKDYKENGNVKIFTGNCDHFTPVLNRFRMVMARYVKIIVVKSSDSCLRVELYGC